MNAPARRLRLGLTRSVCPVCLATVDAERYAVGDTVFLGKTCAAHGRFEVPIWQGVDSYRAWGRGRAAVSPPNLCATEVDKGCPHDCGLCPDHSQQSCCVLLEVTQRCNLACPVCYASAGGQSADPGLAEIDGWLDTLMAAGGRVHVQLSGGEPTVRDDLPEIVQLVRRRGFTFIQLNTNGLRIARDRAYLDRLVDAGLDCVFLQFDGVTDVVHQALRSRPLQVVKEEAIIACAAAGVGVVLVPTIVPGVNDREIGAIVEFAKARLPFVRAVHFQPVSHFGRMPGTLGPGQRITLPEIMAALVAHERRGIGLEDFHPGSAENPYCSFSARFSVTADGRLRAMPAEGASCCGTPAAEPRPRAASCCGSAAPDPAPSPDVDRARRYVAGQWTRADEALNPASMDAFDQFLAGRGRTLGLSGMAFQDAWTLDVERVRQCHIHIVSPDRRLVPFCAYNLTDTAGRTLYRPLPEAERTLT